MKTYHMSSVLQVPYLNINLRQCLIVTQVFGMLNIISQIYHTAKDRGGYTVAVSTPLFVFEFVFVFFLRCDDEGDGGGGGYRYGYSYGYD